LKTARGRSAEGGSANVTTVGLNRELEKAGR
jgi:hypothetical protein